jgi:hypothetical protein
MKTSKLPGIFLTALLIMALTPPAAVSAQTTSPLGIMLSSYSISGNMLTDEVITLNLEFTNTNQYQSIFDVLVSFESINDTFLPAYGISNQFFIPVIQADSSYSYELPISVKFAVPNSIFYFDFTATFTDTRTGTHTNRFFISDTVKTANAIQLLGVEAVEINRLDGNESIVLFRATVINHSN